jgi:hypothetical protein
LSDSYITTPAERGVSALFAGNTTINLRNEWKFQPRVAAVVLGFCVITVFAFLAAGARLNTGLFANTKSKEKF